MLKVEWLRHAKQMGITPLNSIPAKINLGFHKTTWDLLDAIAMLNVGLDDYF